VALLEALGVIDPGEDDPARLAAVAPEAERRAWIARLETALSEPVDEQVLLLPGAPPPPRAEALARIARVVESASARGLAQGQFAGLADGQLSILHGEVAESRPLDPAVPLFRDVNGTHEAGAVLTLAVGERVVYVERDGRIVYLEAEQEPHGAAADAAPRHYNWEVRLTPADVARRIARYGTVGRVEDIVPKRLGVSGRVVELGVVGSEGEIDLRGQRVRLGLGLRENLFVVDRERDPRGEVSRFVITGKGWGHGVGLCQLGAFAMAQTGSTFDAILKHYYTGIALRAPGAGDPAVGHP
jgi:stage II sporulation protein D